jgi:hypothetical protein
MKKTGDAFARLYRRWLVWRLNRAVRQIDRIKDEYDCGWALALAMSRTVSEKLRKAELRQQALDKWDAAHPQST